MRGLAIRIGIIAVIVVIGLIARDFVGGNAGDLKVGDCFDLPSSSSTTVKDVQHHPCDQDHSAEVFFVGDFPGSKSDPLPSEDQFTAFIIESCGPAYKAYTGTDVTAQAIYDVNAFFPLADGWTKGDQSVTCFLFRVDEGTYKGSAKKT